MGNFTLAERVYLRRRMDFNIARARLREERKKVKASARRARLNAIAVSAPELDESPPSSPPSPPVHPTPDTEVPKHTPVDADTQ